MSNRLACPSCGAIGSDATWPAEGWGYLVTQHQVDRLSGTEDPADVAQDGEKVYACRCGASVWRDGGWLLRQTDKGNDARAREDERLDLALTRLELAVLHYVAVLDVQSEPLKDFEREGDDADRSKAEAALASLGEKIRLLAQRADRRVGG